jgi:phosphoribosyl 1,2-cyclic phosphodiesterase
MKITFWGARGSIPTPHHYYEIREKVKKALTLATPRDILSEDSINKFISSLPFSIKGTYGGNSACIEVRASNNELVIIDAGSGIKALGEQIMKEDFGKGKGIASMLFTHTHWDHIQGIPFFVPFYIKGNRFNIYSPLNDIKERIEYQQDFNHFPVNLDYMLATKEFFILEKESEFYLNNLRIINKRMRHPGGSFGYRIEENGKSFVFTSDCEFNIDEIDMIDSYRDFFLNADVVVFDTQYTFEESIDKIDWGHSSAPMAIDIVSKFNVKKLVLFHHDPNYSDEKLETVLARAKAYMSMDKKRKIDLEVEMAYEGLEIDL